MATENEKDIQLSLNNEPQNDAPTDETPLQIELEVENAVAKDNVRAAEKASPTEETPAPTAEDGAFRADNGTTIVLEEAKETVEEPRKTEKLDASYGSDTGRTLEDLVEAEAEEEDTKPVSNFSLKRTLGGVIIARAIQRQIGLVLLITLFLIIYISNRYTCQKQTVQIDKLEKKLNETRYKAIVCTSTLTEKSRESNIIKSLREKGDSTLTIPTQPPYRIKVTK